MQQDAYNNEAVRWLRWYNRDSWQTWDHFLVHGIPWTEQFSTHSECQQTSCSVLSNCVGHGIILRAWAERQLDTLGLGVRLATYAEVHPLLGLKNESPGWMNSLSSGSGIRWSNLNGNDPVISVETPNPRGVDIVGSRIYCGQWFRGPN